MMEMRNGAAGNLVTEKPDLPHPSQFGTTQKAVNAFENSQGHWFHIGGFVMIAVNVLRFTAKADRTSSLLEDYGVVFLVIAIALLTFGFYRSFLCKEAFFVRAFKKSKFKRAKWAMKDLTTRPQRPTPEDFSTTQGRVNFYSRYFRYGLLFICALVAIRIANGMEVESVSWFLSVGLFGYLSYFLISLLTTPLFNKEFWYEWALSDYPDLVKKYEAKEQQELLRKQRAFWTELSGRDFEKELTTLFKRDGYRAEMTPATDDKGVDIRMTRGEHITIVQCKQHQKPAGPAIARELYGTLMASDADDAILACTAGVSSGAQDFLKGKPIQVMDVDDIVALQKRVAK